MSDQPAATHEETPFPASENTPGQAESRSSFARFQELQDDCPWFEDFKQLRSEGWTWRLAAYIAWASTPAIDRWPASQQELAVKILGLRSDRTIRKWREKRPQIDERIAKLQVEPLMRHRRDVIDALIDVAKHKDPGCHQDRKLFLEITGDYKRQSGVDVTTGGQPLKGYIGVSPDDWDEAIDEEE